MRVERRESESYSNTSLEKRRKANREVLEYAALRQDIAKMRGVSVLTPDFKNHIYTPAFE